MRLQTVGHAPLTRFDTLAQLLHVALAGLTDLLGLSFGALNLFPTGGREFGLMLLQAFHDTPTALWHILTQRLYILRAGVTLGEGGQGGARQ
jgi:hypothetical protein